MPRRRTHIPLTVVMPLVAAAISALVVLCLDAGDVRRIAMASAVLFVVLAVVASHARLTARMDTRQALSGYLFWRPPADLDHERGRRRGPCRLVAVAGNHVGAVSAVAIGAVVCVALAVGSNSPGPTTPAQGGVQPAAPADRGPQSTTPPPEPRRPPAPAADARPARTVTETVTAAAVPPAEPIVVTVTQTVPAEPAAPVEPVTDEDADPAPAPLPAPAPVPEPVPVPEAPYDTGRSDDTAAPIPACTTDCSAATDPVTVLAEVTDG